MADKNAEILIVEDEKNFASFVEKELQHEGYQTAVAYDGLEGLELALDKEWDLILLDLMLPEIGGLEVCQRVREVKGTPIIIMTARDSLTDRVSGLDYGADDYIVKPFEIEELLARIRALLRRVDLGEQKYQKEQHQLVFKDLVVDKDNRTVRRGEEKIKLTKREFELLVVLMENINVVMSRQDLLNQVWEYDNQSEVETNVVDVYIRYLRNKIDVKGQPSHIQTVRGTGYVMRTDDE